MSSEVFKSINTTVSADQNIQRYFIEFSFKIEPFLLTANSF